MIPRILENWLDRVADQPQIVQIYGLRQTGKTTLMENFKERYPHHLYYPLYDLVTLRIYESNPEKWVLEIEDYYKKNIEDKTLHVFIDEIQKIPDLFQALQGLYQKYKGKIKFWIWGSSARPLKRQRAETLAGRSLSRTLWPLSYSEISRRESQIIHLFEPTSLEKNIEINKPRGFSQDLKKLFQSTLLPEPYLLKDQLLVEDLIAGYQASYIENEIRRENLVQDIGVFERFLNLAASENTEIVNYSAQAKVLGIDSKTIKNYYGILEDTFVIRSLPAYSKSLRVQTSKSPKIYFTDTGLARFISGERGFPSENTRSYGKLIEGFVINEIMKQIEYHALPWKLSYLRTKHNLEVDLIITQGKESIAVEIKNTSKINSSDYKSLLQMMELDPSIKYGVIISNQSAPFRVHKKIYNFPLWNI